MQVSSLHVELSCYQNEYIFYLYLNEERERNNWKLLLDTGHIRVLAKNIDAKVEYEVGNSP